MCSSLRIMIIEDEAIIALGLKKSLTDLGHCVQSMVGSGKEALELISKVQPDLIFIDIKLPGEINGIETAHFINENYEIPMIICTGCSNKEILEECKKFNPSGILFKPFNDNLLADEIRSAISKYNNNKIETENKKR
jgi:two-component system, response regulator PdtaR